MAVVPITFDADIVDNEKGNIRAEDLSALLSFAYPDVAGILNISGQDCSAFGNVNIVGNTAQVTFHKGYIVVFGRALYFQEGTEVAFNLPASGSVSGILGIKINLAESGANEVTWFQKTTNAQTDNLLKNNTSGVYEFVLYNYTATPNSFVLGNKTSEIVDNILTFFNKKVTTDVANYENNGLSLKLVRNKSTNVVFGEISGYLKTSGASISYPEALFNASIQSYVFNLGDPFIPQANKDIFHKGSGGFKTSPYSQVLISGTTKNDYIAYISDGGQILNNGTFAFKVTGVRHSADSTVVLHPFKYCFMYEV